MFDQNKNSFQNNSHQGLFKSDTSCESRLIFQNKKDSKPDQAQTDKPADAKAENKDTAAKPEVVDQSADAKKIVIDKMKHDIGDANQKLKSVEAQLTPNAQQYLENYFNSSVERFDKDKDGKINAQEAEVYKNAMFAKTKAMIDEYAPTDAQKKATEAKNTAAKAVEKPADVAKTVGEIKEISAGLDLQGSLTEFQSMQTQNNAFQSSVSESIASVQGFHATVVDFHKKQEGWHALSHAWNEFIHPFSKSDGEAAEEKIKAEIAAAKVSAQAKLTDLKAKKATLDANGEKIKAAIAKERQKIISDRDAKVAEMKEQEADQTENIVEKKKKYDEIKKKQDELTEQQKNLQGKQAKQQEFRKNWSEVKDKEQWETRQKAFTESKKDTSVEMGALQIILDDPRLTPELKAKVQKEYDEVAARNKSSETNLGLVTERIETGKKMDRKLTDDEKANLSQINSVDGYLKGQVEPALASTSSTIAKLEELKVQYATQAGEVSEYYNKKVDQIDQLSESVADFTLSSAVGREKSINAMESAVKSLDSLEVNNSGFFKSIVLGIPQGILHGIGEGCHDLAKWIDGNTGYMLDNTDGGWHVLGQVGALFTGFLSGGVDLVGGVFTMAAHPWETVKGLTALVGYDAKKGEFSVETFKATWKHLGSSLVGAGEWEKGHYGSSVGKFAFNVLSMFVGVGEAKAAGEAGMVGRAAAASSKARVVAVTEAVAKGASETWMMGRGAQIVEFAKTLAVEATPKFVKDAGKAGAKEVGVINKTGAVMKSLGGAISEATPKFLKNAWEAGSIAKEAGKSRILAVTKSLAGSTVRGAVTAAVFTGKVYKELLLAPVSAIRATGRFVKELPRLAGRIRSEGIVNVYRASKLSEAASVISRDSAAYGQARERIAKIISEDEKLLQLSKDPATAKAAEAEASIKLLREDPKLFDAYTNVEEATATLSENTTKMAEDIQSNIKKVKENPEIAYEVSEHNLLKERYDAAKTKFDNTPKPTSNPVISEVKIVDADQISKIDQYVERSSGQNGWTKAQKAEVREALMASDDLGKTAPEAFARKMQSIADDFTLGKRPFVGTSADAKAYAEIQSEFSSAEKSLKSFERDRKRMDKVDEYYKADKVEQELSDLLTQRTELQEKYLGSPKEDLAKLEGEIGEARAVRDGRITAETDTPEFINKARADFEAAAKSGKIDELEKATNTFGTYEPTSELGKMLEAIHRKANGKTVKPGYVDQNFYANFDKPFKEALKSGNMEEIGALRKNPEAAKYAEYFDFMEYKYYTENADLRTVFQRNQKELLQDYELYNRAARNELRAGDSAIAIQKSIRDRHPNLKKAFDEIDFRQNYLLHNDVVTHSISAIRIKTELPELIKPTMKAEEAASKLQKRYAGQPMGADAIGREVGEVILGEGTAAKTYKVRLEGAGDVKLISPDGSVVRTLEEIAADGKAAKALKQAPAETFIAPSATAPLVPAEYTEYFDLRLNKAEAKAKLDTVINTDKHLPAIDRTKTVTTMTDFSLETLNKVTEKLGKEMRLTMDELTAVRDSLIESKKLDALPIDKPINSRAFNEAIEAAVTDKAFELQSLRRSEKYAQELTTAEKALATFESDTAKLKIAQEYKSSGSAAPAVDAVKVEGATVESATASPVEKPASLRRDEAIQLLEESKSKLEVNKKALRDQEQNLKTAQDAYNIREASGKYSPESLKGLQTKIDSAKSLVAETKSRISTLEETISASRKDKWVSRAEASGDRALSYLTSPLRSEWLNKTISRLKTIKGMPGELVNSLVKVLQEQALVRYGNVKLLSEKGLNIARSIKNYWDKTHDQNRPLSRLYDEILDDQLVLMGQISNSMAAHTEQLKALTAGEKIAAIESEWNQIASNGGGIGGEQLYTDAELDYTKDRKAGLRKAIDSVRGQEDVTATTLQQAIDTELGPEGNDTNKSYQIALDGITINVDKDGHRTYDGLEKWLADAPNKKLVGASFKEITGIYAGLDKASALKLNNGKPYANTAELGKQIEKKLMAEIVKNIAGKDLKEGLTVYSKTRTGDEANFVAKIEQSGKINLTINEKWVQKIYDQSTGKAKPEQKTPGTPTDEPVIADEKTESV